MTEPSRQRVELLEKNKPQQARAKRTYESILESAAALLVEVGIERISTNLVAERAGVTVPAVYRYFPNKYAVLHALGARLMDKQNAVFQHWFDDYLLEGDPRTLLDNVHILLQQTHGVTQHATGGREIVQALRAVTPLQELRLDSHRLIADQFALTVAPLLGREQDELVKAQARLSIDLGYAIVEMMLEERGASTELLLQEGARMIQLYWQGVFGTFPRV
jgi:AcrR family transcriptional regulator